LDGDESSLRQLGRIDLCHPRGRDAASGTPFAERRRSAQATATVPALPGGDRRFELGQLVLGRIGAF